uniref:Uncharacterized protein n=1 Tax=Myotis myotis TaxID=51298 RepID=A0A7J7UPS5_MYOMY|nr:hypothetical protein mMyoMyo1_008554 [Myotis myotis]
MRKQARSPYAAQHSLGPASPPSPEAPAAPALRRMKGRCREGRCFWSSSRETFRADELAQGASRTRCVWRAEGSPLVFPRDRGDLSCFSLTLGCQTGVSFERDTGMRLGPKAAPFYSGYRNNHRNGSS